MGGFRVAQTHIMLVKSRNSGGTWNTERSADKPNMAGKSKKKKKDKKFKKRKIRNRKVNENGTKKGY